MASDLSVLCHKQFRQGLAANRHCVLAPGMKWTARRDIFGVWRITEKDNALPFPGNVHLWYGGNQGLGIGVEWSTQHLLRGSVFHNPAQIHDSHIITDVLDNREVMRNENIR